MIGGMTPSTVLTLIVFPVIFGLIGSSPLLIGVAPSSANSTQQTAAAPRAEALGEPSAEAALRVLALVR
jgi:hypothetical protein